MQGHFDQLCHQITRDLERHEFAGIAGQAVQGRATHFGHGIGQQSRQWFGATFVREMIERTGTIGPHFWSRMLESKQQTVHQQMQAFRLEQVSTNIHNVTQRNRHSRRQRTNIARGQQQQFTGEIHHELFASRDFWWTFDTCFQSRPTLKPVLSSDHELRVSKLERLGARERSDATHGFNITGTERLEQCFGLLSQVLQAWRIG